MFTRHYCVWPEHVPRQLSVPETSLFENLANSARRFPDKTAIVYYDTELSYRELLAEVEALAGYLQHAGVQRGERVLLYMQNSPQFVIGYYAILRADAVVVPVNPMNRTEELEHYLIDTGARVSLCAQELVPTLEPLLVAPGRLERLVVTAYAEYLRKPTDLPLPAELDEPFRAPSLSGAIGWRDALEAGHLPGPHRSMPVDLCVLPYSSGTTGAPKGCVHTHRTVMAAVIQRSLWAQTFSDQVVLATLPFFHVTGMQGGLNGPVYTGSTMVIMTRWNREVAGELMQRYRVNIWINIATMAIDYLSAPDADRFDTSSLTYVGGGGAAMPEAVEARLRRLAGLPYIEGYGMSETIGATHANPLHLPKPQCLGVPVCGVDSRIVDPDTLTELGPNEVGEIITHTPSLFEGYWGRPEETAEVFVERDGKRFFRTGDLAYHDEQGYFFMVDRIKRMINASGFKVWPCEVEGLMYRHPAIRECCVIAKPDARRGETVKACIVLNDGQQVAEADIVQWARQEMATYKAPTCVEFMSSLPRSSTGKVLWRKLQEWERERELATTAG
ncbi:long-chain fatty acid--CoA ligase [Stutzerimonas tarimensis]|uniref:Long-chain fatty acid--CoA ligase n=1 Tax=Stutzerimonas tarimensis TaxID=1507735 RepID=A0ABV7T9C6_9GAMM